MKPEDMIGKVCVCSHGRIGIVKSFRQDSQGILYEGERFFGGGAWQSRRPLILNGSDVSALRGEDRAETPERPVERTEVSEPRLSLTDAPKARRKRSRPTTE